MYKDPFRDLLAQYTVTGVLNSFTGNTLIRWADDKQISGEMTFDMTNRKRVTFSLSSPFYSNYLLIGLTVNNELLS